MKNEFGALAAPIDRLAQAMMQGPLIAAQIGHDATIQSAAIAAKAAQETARGVASSRQDTVFAAVQSLGAVATALLAMVALYFAIRKGVLPSVELSA